MARHLLVILVALAAVACTEGLSPASPAAPTAAPSAWTPTPIPTSGSRSPSPAAPTAPPTVGGSSSATAPAGWRVLADDPSLDRAVFRDVASGPLGLLAVGSTTATGDPTLLAWTSIDGRTWKETQVGSRVVGAEGRDVVASPAGWVITGRTVEGERDRPAIWTSADGQQWQEVPVQGPLGLADPVIAGNRLIAYAIEEPLGGSSWLAWSTGDLVRWEARDLTARGYAEPEGLTTLADGRALIWASFNSTPTDVTPTPVGSKLFLVSDDGLAWSATAGDGSFDNTVVAALAHGGPGGYAAIGCAWTPEHPDMPPTLVAWSSSDALDWIPARMTGADAMAGRCSGMHLGASAAGWVLVGDLAAGGSGVIGTSVDGMSWTVLDEPAAFGGLVTEMIPFGKGLLAVGAALDANGEPASARTWVTTSP